MPTWTVEEITILRTAIASGLLTVSYDGPPRRSVTYQSLTAMRALLASMESEATGPDGGSNYKLIATRKGL